MKQIINFLNTFFEAETKAWDASIKPNLEDFNNKLEYLNSLVIENLENSFGLIPMKELESSEFYEDYSDTPPTAKRYLFRIDEYIGTAEEKLFMCYLSRSNPSRKKIANVFLIKQKNNEAKIFSKFVLSKRSVPVEWRFTGGDTTYRTKLSDKSLLNKGALGERTNIYRLLEPSDSEESMKLYNED